jgi:hypothetical protein
MYFIQYYDQGHWRNASYDSVPTLADAEYLLVMVESGHGSS